MQIEKLSLPEGWEEHESYARRARGIVASYHREDWLMLIDVVEYKPNIESNFKVELIAADDSGETMAIESKDADTYEEIPKIVLEFIEQCN